MATTAYNFAEGDIKLRYREPYLSDSLNTKYQYIVTSGVYDGFLPSVTGAAALHLLLRPADTGSVAVASSNILGASAYQVSVHIPAPTVLDLDLSSYVNKTVAVVLEASFQRPSVTSASIKVYDLATETVPSAAVVFCEVTVPASGAIPAANVNLNGRSLPWDLRGRDAIPLIDIVKNGTFHFFTNGQTTDLPAPYWNLTAGDGSLAVVNTLGPEGVNDNVLVATAVAGANTVKVSQPNTVPVAPTTMRVRVQAYYQQVGTLTTGNAAVKVYFRNANNPATVTDTVTLPLVLPTGGTVGTWYYLERFVTVEATSSYAKYLSSVEIDLNASEWAAIGTAFRLTNVSVEVEQSGKASDLLLENTGDIRTSSLRIVDSTLTGPNAGYAKVFYTDSTNILTISDETGGAVRVVLTGRFDAGSVFAPFIDYAGALSLGTTDATAISIGKTGVLTTIAGNLLVSGSTTLGDIVAPSLDSTGTLLIGTTTQTGLTLGRGAVNTSITGAVVNATASTDAYIDGLTNLFLGVYSSAVHLGLVAGSGVVYLRSRLDALAGGNLFFGTQEANTVQIGRNTSGTTTASYLYGDTVYLAGKIVRVGTETDAVSVTIGKSGVTTSVVGLLTASAGIQTASLNALSTVLNIGATTETINIVATSAINIGTITSQPVTIGSILSTNSFNGLALTIAAANTVTIGGGSGTAIGTGPLDGTVTISRVGSTSQVAGYFQSNYLDATASTNTLSIGTQASGTIVIGKGGQIATIVSALNVTGSATFGVTTTFNASVTITAGTLTLQTGTALDADGTTYLYAQNIDRANSGATLSIGATNASTVFIGRVGQNTNIKGKLAVAQNATFDADVVANAGTLYADTIDAAVTPYTGSIGIGTGTTTTGITLGRSGITTTINGQVSTPSLSASLLYAGAAVTANRVTSCAYGYGTYSGALAITTSASNVPIDTSEFSSGLTVDTTTNSIKSIPSGYYRVDFGFFGTTNGSVGSPTKVTFTLEGSPSAYYPSNFNKLVLRPTSAGGTAFTGTQGFYLSASFVVFATANNTELYFTAVTDTGQLNVVLDTASVSVYRIFPSP